MFLYFPIPLASLAYNIQVLLDRMSDGQLIFDAVLRNASHPITQDLSDITTHGISQAMMDSSLGPRYHTATITKFSDTKEMVMPASVDDMVSLERKVGAYASLPVALALISIPLTY